MSTAAAGPAVRHPKTEAPSTLELYRDDGVVARALSGLGRGVAGTYAFVRRIMASYEVRGRVAQAVFR